MEFLYNFTEVELAINLLIICQKTQKNKIYKWENASEFN